MPVPFQFLSNVCGRMYVFWLVYLDDNLSLPIVTVTNNPITMQRLAGAEEVLRVPDNQLSDSPVNKEIENSVQACLLKVWFRHFLEDIFFLFFFPSNYSLIEKITILCRGYFVRIIMENKSVSQRMKLYSRFLLKCAESSTCQNLFEKTLVVRYLKFSNCGVEKRSVPNIWVLENDFHKLLHNLERVILPSYRYWIELNNINIYKYDKIPCILECWKWKSIFGCRLT